MSVSFSSCNGKDCKVNESGNPNIRKSDCCDCSKNKPCFDYCKNSTDCGMDSCEFSNCCPDGNCSNELLENGCNSGDCTSAEAPAAGSSSANGGGGSWAIPDSPCLFGVGGTLFQGANSMFGFGSGEQQQA